MRKLTLAAAAAVLSFTLGLRAEINPQNFDPSVKPQDDFFRYVNGGWLKTVVIPGDQARWGSFNELILRNEENLRMICERLITKAATLNPTERLVADFYVSGMDQATIDAAGIAPLKPELERIAAVKSPGEVMAAIAHLQRSGVPVGFSFGSSPDSKDSTHELAQLSQGGLGLPDRDYYFFDDDKSKKIREQYVAHIAHLFELAGQAPEAAKADAAAVMKLETALADASMTRVQQRDPYGSYHKMAVDQVGSETAGIDWKAFFEGVGASRFENINLAQPAFFKRFAAELSATPVADWQAYLRWQLLNVAAPYLSRPFEEADFNFFSATLTGVTEMKPRWKRVVNTIDGGRPQDVGIGNALGQLYVAEFFPPEAKARVLQLVANLRAALRERLQVIEWMDAPTRAKAQAKLDAFTVKMGYPDKWKDYSTLKIDRGPYVLNVLRSRAYETAREIAKIGKPVDKTEWGMSPPTVNAYYRQSANEIVFPAGILQPPFFDAKADDAVNYGGIGAVIGHEMTHGFDDQGRQYDGEGNLTDWWSKESAEQFKARADGIVKQFSAYTISDGTTHLNGQLTQGENIADLGGLKLSFAALQKALAGKPREKIDGFTPEQRFFLNYATVWRNIMRPAEERRRVVIDPHAPGEWRVNGPLSNLDEFAKAFDVPEGAPMRRPADQRVSIW
jgi:putative endopeptidase